MIRIAFEDILLFLIPFGIFGLILLVLRKNVLHLEHWSRAWLWLLMAGFGVVIAWTIFFFALGERHTGPYVPPHMENGRPVPGGFR